MTDLAGYGAVPGAPYLDFGARLYSPRTATWLSPDPLMEKYYGVSPFVYCIGNPIVLIDPIGRVIKVIGSEEFIAKYNAAKAFLENRGVANSLSVLDEASDITIVIKESCSSTFDANTNTINWSSSIMSLSDDKTIMRSPTLSLAHEIEHAVEFYANREVFLSNVMEYDLEFDNKEERRVITGPEQTIARALGEINQDQVTRKSHRGYSSRNADGLSPERQSRIAFLYNNPLNKLDDSVFQLTLNLYE